MFVIFSQLLCGICVCLVSSQVSAVRDVGLQIMGQLLMGHIRLARALLCHFHQTVLSSAEIMNFSLRSVTLHAIRKVLRMLNYRAKQSCILRKLHPLLFELLAAFVGLFLLKSTVSQ